MNQPIHTDRAPAAIGPYSQAVLAGNTLYVSVQLGADAAGNMPEGVAAQAEQSLQNLGAILEQAGMGFENVVKTTVFLQSMDDFAQVNENYARFFSAPYPARACVQVAKLPRAGLVEIECIAVK